MMKKNVSAMSAIDPLFQKIAGLNKLYRILICVATVVVLLAAFGYFLYKPKLDRMATLRNDITTAEQRLNTTKRNAQDYDLYKQKMEEARVQFITIAQELPSTEEIPSLLTSISQAGGEAGLKFLLFQPQSETLKEFYAEIPIRMELSGRYHELGNFFDRVAHLSRIVNIDNCSTQRSGDLLRITCTAITYRFIGSPAGQ